MRNSPTKPYKKLLLKGSHYKVKLAKFVYGEKANHELGSAQNQRNSSKIYSRYAILFIDRKNKKKHGKHIF